MSDEEMIGRVVRTVEYNIGNGGPDAIDAHQIRVHLCANAKYPAEAVSRAIADALERGDLVERDTLATSPPTHRPTASICDGIRRTHTPT